MYYNGDKILNNKQPFNFLLGNRGTGKSFYFKRYCIRNFINNKKQFIYVRRYKSDLDKVMKNLFDDIQPKFPNDNIRVDKNTIFINDDVAGWCISVSEFIKYKSASFPNVYTIMFDEFLPEDGKYLGGKDNYTLEPELCLNFYQSVARGYNQPIRDDVLFLFIANSVTINNPYFYYFNIDKQLKDNTKFLKGKGFNVEINRNESISSEITNSKFGDLIKGSKYEDYALNNSFYLDNDEFVRKIKEQKSYIMTFLFNKNKYGLWRTRSGLYYITDKAEPNSKSICSLNSNDHTEESVLVTKLNQLFIKDLIRAYAGGKVYFSNQRAKSFFDNAINK